MDRHKAAVLAMDAAVNDLDAAVHLGDPPESAARRAVLAWRRLARLMWPPALGDADAGPDLVVDGGPPDLDC